MFKVTSQFVEEHSGHLILVGKIAAFARTGPAPASKQI